MPMKLKEFITVCCLLLATAASAQRTYEPHFYIGARGGVTMSNMSFTPSVEQGMRMGTTFGVSARYIEEKFFGLIAEVNFEQRGWKENFDETEFRYSRQLTYIQIPLLTHIYFGGKKVKGFVNLGPSVGYLMSDSRSANFDYENPGSVEGFPIANRYVNQMKMEVKNKFDYGIMAGAGIEFIIKQRHSLTLEGRYYFGLGNVFPATKKDEFSASRSTMISVALGYQFRIK